MFRFAKGSCDATSGLKGRLAMQRALVLLFVALSVEAANAQSTGRDPGRDDALEAAIAISANIQFMFKRLSFAPN